jgi:hypothetical protein
MYVSLQLYLATLRLYDEVRVCVALAEIGVLLCQTRAVGSGVCGETTDGPVEPEACVQTPKLFWCNHKHRCCEAANQAASRALPIDVHSFVA